MRIHYKLTDTHLNPDKAEKMRNHLATEVLNKDMLHLMQVLRNHLHVLFCYNVYTIKYFALKVNAGI